MASSKKKNYTLITILISFLLGFVLRLIISHVVGSKGVAYFSVSNETFFLFAGMFGFGLEEATSQMVLNRLSRQQYINARRVANCGALLGIIVGLLMSFILFLLRNKILDSLFSMHLSYLSFAVALVSIPFMVSVGALRGYFKGSGLYFVNMISQLVFGGSYFIFGTIMSFVFLDYGTRVSGLLKVEEYTYSYGAFGASIGIFVASLFTFIHILFMYILQIRRTRYDADRDYSKQSDYLPNIYINLGFMSLVPMGIVCLNCLSVFLSLAFLSKNKGLEYSMEFSIGEYYGKTFSIVGIAIMIIMFFAFPYLRGAVISLRKEEYRLARERLSRLVHKMVTVTVFVAGMIAVLADNILDILFASNGENTVTYLQIESLCIFFTTFAIIFIDMILRLQNYVYVLVITAGAFIIRLLASLLLAITFKMSINGILISSIIYYAILAVSAFMYISRAFQYTQEFFRTFVADIVAGLVCAVLGMLLNKAVAPLVGKAISALIVLIVCFLVYVIIILALKGYREDELEETPIGRAILTIGRTINLI